MKTTDRHLSTQELLQFADGELSVRRRRAREISPGRLLGVPWQTAAIRKHDQRDHGPASPRLRSSVAARRWPARVAEGAAGGNGPLCRSTPLGPLHRGRGVAAVILMMFTAGILDRPLHGGVKDEAASRFGLRGVRRFPTVDLTPGAARFVSTSELCASQYSDDARAVPTEIRQRVFQEYGMARKVTQLRAGLPDQSGTGRDRRHQQLMARARVIRGCGICK